MAAHVLEELLLGRQDEHLVEQAQRDVALQPLGVLHEAAEDGEVRRVLLAPGLEGGQVVEVGEAEGALLVGGAGVGRYDVHETAAVAAHLVALVAEEVHAALQHGGEVGAVELELLGERGRDVLARADDGEVLLAVHPDPLVALRGGGGLGGVLLAFDLRGLRDGEAVAHAAPVDVLLNRTGLRLLQVRDALWGPRVREDGLETVDRREEDLHEPPVPSLDGIDAIPPRPEPRLRCPRLVGLPAGPVRHHGQVVEALGVRDGRPLVICRAAGELGEALERLLRGAVGVGLGGVLRADDGHDEAGRLLGELGAEGWEGGSVALGHPGGDGAVGTEVLRDRGDGLDGCGCHCDDVSNVRRRQKFESIKILDTKTLSMVYRTAEPRSR